MKVLIGLGNPGKEYERTRHNAGFLVVDAIAKQHNLSFRLKQSVQAELAEGEINGQRVLLCKPHTFMNASGNVVQSVMKKYPVTPEDLVVIYDDADLPFADVRSKTGGGSAGHRGMESILSLFPPGTQIKRVRFGIGRPDHVDTALEAFVLQPWSSAQTSLLENVIAKAVSLVLSYVV